MPEEESDSSSESDSEDEAYTYVTFTGEIEENSQVIFNKKGIKICGHQYDWFQYERLKAQMERKPSKKASWIYAPWGPGARCWCENRLYSQPPHSSSGEYSRFSHQHLATRHQESKL